jgi:hypothetical protein
LFLFCVNGSKDKFGICFQVPFAVWLFDCSLDSKTGVFFVAIEIELVPAFLVLPIFEPSAYITLVLEFEAVQLFHLDEIETLDLDFWEEDAWVGERIILALGFRSWVCYEEIAFHVGLRRSNACFNYRIL